MTIRPSGKLSNTPTLIFYGGPYDGLELPWPVDGGESTAPQWIVLGRGDVHQPMIEELYRRAFCRSRYRYRQQRPLRCRPKSRHRPAVTYDQVLGYLDMNLIRRRVVYRYAYTGHTWAARIQQITLENNRLLRGEVD